MDVAEGKGEDSTVDKHVSWSSPEIITPSTILVSLNQATMIPTLKP